MSGSVKTSWQDSKSEFFLSFQISENDTFDNVHHLTMVYVTLKPLLYSFFRGTEVNFKETFAGVTMQMGESSTV